MEPDESGKLDLTDFLAEPLRTFFEGVRDVCESTYEPDVKVKYPTETGRKVED